MTSLEGCTAEQIRELAIWTGRLKHDLGKYIWFRQAWLGDDATDEARRDAVIADVHHTRRGPAGSVAAAEVWREFRAGLCGEIPLGRTSVVLDDPRVDQIQRALEELARHEPLQTASVESVARASTLCQVVATAIRDLARDTRVRAGVNG